MLSAIITGMYKRSTAIFVIKIAVIVRAKLIEIKRLFISKINMTLRAGKTFASQLRLYGCHSRFSLKKRPVIGGLVSVILFCL